MFDETNSNISTIFQNEIQYLRCILQVLEAMDGFIII